MPNAQRIEVDIAPSIAPPAAGDESAVESTKQAARKAILQRISEPDLAADQAGIT
jgi:hypothetical protein